ncbi:hypothetical protein ISS07_05955 [Candidatus Woesearchaeota archaeon]|nr:hypothetical protein [Candidatus Woesearchaeota archaeon]
MDQKVREDAASVLEHASQILRVKEDKDIFELRSLSNRIIHNASLFQDECSVSVAVLIYSLYKVISRRDNHLNYLKIVKLMDRMLYSLRNNDEVRFKELIKQAFSEVSRIDNKLGMYVSEVITEAQVKKGCKLCEHGLSIAKASEVMGVSQWELMKYFGNTSMEDVPGVGVTERLKLARGLFS